MAASDVLLASARIEGCVDRMVEGSSNIFKKGSKT